MKCDKNDKMVHPGAYQCFTEVSQIVHENVRGVVFCYHVHLLQDLRQHNKAKLRNKLP